jgi:hypothetical protein
VIQLTGGAGSTVYAHPSPSLPIAQLVATASRSPLKILMACLGSDAVMRGGPGSRWLQEAYASAQVPSLVGVSPRLTSRRRLRAATQWWSQVLFLVMPR